ncbi:MAG: 2Fe-2S iron-sulfur cluster-binding protein [Spirochaetia bacterium]
MAKIQVPQLDTIINASSAVSILNNLLRNGISIMHRCGGKAQCGTCRVRIIQGMEKTNKRNIKEQALFEKLSLEKDVRLSCQTYAFGDIEIEILNR